jgi:hypothetical protein
MSGQLREYSGLLGVRLTAEQSAAVKNAADEAGLEVDIAETYLELEYSGPDSNRFVVRLLQRLAEIVGNAEGEIKCEITSDGDTDPTFEFYSFSGGKLHCQQAALVRGPKTRV